MKKKLSKRQQSIYEYICSYSAEHGYPPSVREIGAAVGLASPSTVHMHLQVLQEQGLIKRDSKKPRAIEVVNNPSVHDEGLHLAKVTEDPDSNTISLPLNQLAPCRNPGVCASSISSVASLSFR